MGSPLPGTGRSPVQPNDASGNHLLGFSLQFWMLLVLTGIGAGLLMKLLRAVQHFCYSYGVGTFLQAVQRAPVNRRVVVVFGAGVVASIGVFLLKETPGGSGGKLNERIWFHSGRLAELKTIAQSILSMTIVGMGAFLGRETAPKQTGAAVASWLSRQAALCSAESRLLAACGAGAGMGAVYNVPFGGALFALEVLLGTLAFPLVPPALAASVIATVVSWLMLPDQPTYTVASYPVTLTQLIWSIGFGPVAGLASVLYVRLIVFADGLKPKRGVALALTLVAFLALGLLAIRYPQLLGNGKDVTQLGFTGALSLPLERFVSEVGDPKPLYVIDEEAKLSGRIEARNLSRPHALTQVLSTAAARDVMEQIEPLVASMTEAEVLARLRAEPAGELPVVDSASGRLLGIAESHQIVHFGS